MIVRRDQFDDKPNHQQTGAVGITTRPVCNLVASALCHGTFAPPSTGMADCPAGATQRICRIVKVIFLVRQSSLLMVT
jgi:hypothetical protein